MGTNLKEILKRVRFYILLLGGFLGIEIPLFIFTYFRFFPQHRNLIWLFTLVIGIGTALIVFFLINAIINEDYDLKLIYDNHDYNSMLGGKK